MGELWKLFRSRQAGIHRQRPRRKAELHFGPHRAEVAGAEEGGEIALWVGVEDQLEAGKAEVAGQLATVHAALAVVEHGGVVGELLG